MEKWSFTLDRFSVAAPQGTALVPKDSRNHVFKACRPF